MSVESSSLKERSLVNPLRKGGDQRGEFELGVYSCSRKSMFLPLVAFSLWRSTSTQLNPYNSFRIKRPHESMYLFADVGVEITEPLALVSAESQARLSLKLVHEFFGHFLTEKKIKDILCASPSDNFSSPAGHLCATLFIQTPTHSLLPMNLASSTREVSSLFTFLFLSFSSTSVPHCRSTPRRCPRTAGSGS